MATFQVQVEGLTSLSVGTTPSTAELAEFLKDGVMDVTNRWLAIRPQDIEDFVRGSSTQSSNGFATSGANIVSVIREAGADGDTDGSTAWEPCRKVPSSMRSRVVDVDSLSYASKYNPVYIINNNSAVNVYPVPDGTNDGYRVYYVNNEPKGDGIVDALAAGHSTIGYFPKDKVYLVVIYAAMRTLQAVMGSKSISTLSVTAVPPDTPSVPSYSAVTVSAQTAGSLGTAPTYTAPSLESSSDQITEMEAGTIGSAETDTEQWFNIAGQYIEDQEDSELASAQISKINTYLNAYGQAMQNQLNIFNDANVEYQSTVQEALQELQVAAAKAQKDADFEQQKQIDEYAKKLQRYQNEIAAYQADVASQIQEYQANIQEATTEYQWLQGQYIALKQDYDGAFGIAMPKQAAAPNQAR